MSYLLIVRTLKFYTKEGMAPLALTRCGGPISFTQYLQYDVVTLVPVWCGGGGGGGGGENS